MTLIVLHPIMFANCRKPLSHKAWWAETQPLDRSDDGILSGAASRVFLVLIQQRFRQRNYSETILHLDPDPSERFMFYSLPFAC